MKILIIQIDENITVNSEIRSGQPVVPKTRFPIARVLAELSDSYHLNDIVADYGLEPKQLAKTILSLATAIEHAAEAEVDEELVNRCEIVMERWGNDGMPAWFEWPFPGQISEAYLKFAKAVRRAKE